MSDTEKRVLATFGRVLPKLSDEGKKTLLILGEGIAIGAGAMRVEETSLAEKDEKKDLEPV